MRKARTYKHTLGILHSPGPTGDQEGGTRQGIRSNQLFRTKISRGKLQDIMFNLELLNSYVRISMQRKNSCGEFELLGKILLLHKCQMFED